MSQHRAFFRHRLAALLLAAGVAAGSAAIAGPAGAQDGRGALGATPASAPTAISRAGMVVAQERLAAQIGADILARGGNAVDAAVATGFALAVTYPRAGNLGGGGFMLIYPAASREAVAIDFREMAPQAATPTMFLGTDGNPDPVRSRDSALGVGVPGTVAGLTLAHQKYGSGRFALADLIAPAIRLARDGIPVTDDTADSLPQARDRLARWPASAAIFLHPDGRVRGEGDRLVQPDLAATLDAIAQQGADGFYRGPIAEKIAAAVVRAGGLMTTADLAGYAAMTRAPVRGTYRGLDVISMPLPSSGGIVLIETLNMLEGFDLAARGADAPVTRHLLIESLKRSYADRAFYLGDPAFAAAPVARLVDKHYAERLRSGIDLSRATPSMEIRPSRDMPREGGNTTHYSVSDAAGNAVATTTTLNFSYGLGMVADGTGILLNNELDDFTAAVGAANAFGLVGFEANLPGPGKRPLSSMTPTIVLKEGRPYLITGSPGGSRIISAVLQVISNVVDHGMDLGEAVSRPRLHHQWLPDEVRVENGFPSDQAEALKKLGHTVREPLGQTSANSILWRDNGWHGAADPRTRGAAAVSP